MNHNLERTQQMFSSDTSKSDNPTFQVFGKRYAEPIVINLSKHKNETSNQIERKESQHVNGQNLQSLAELKKCKEREEDKRAKPYSLNIPNPSLYSSHSKVP